jgi:hypothetical protein
MKLKRMYLAGLRAVCDVAGHRWVEATGDDDRRCFTCRRCRTIRSGTPLRPA